MAQKNYLAVVRPAKDKLDPTDALLLADLQEGGHTIENDLAEIIRGGKTDYGVNAVSEEFKLTIGNIPGDKGIEQVKKQLKMANNCVYGCMNVTNVMTVNIMVYLPTQCRKVTKCRSMMKITKLN